MPASVRQGGGLDVLAESDSLAGFIGWVNPPTNPCDSAYRVRRVIRITDLDLVDS